MFAFASLEKLERLMKSCWWRHFRETSFNKRIRVRHLRFRDKG